MLLSCKEHRIWRFDGISLGDAEAAAATACITEAAAAASVTAADSIAAAASAASKSLQYYIRLLQPRWKAKGI